MRVHAALGPCHEEGALFAGVWINCLVRFFQDIAVDCCVNCGDHEIVPEIYYLKNCAYCEVFVLLVNCAGLSVRLKFANDCVDWRSMTPGGTVPFMIVGDRVAHNSRDVLTVLTESDSRLGGGDKGVILDIHTRWIAVVDGYINNEIKGQYSDGFSASATKEFSTILDDFQLLGARGRIYAAAIIMPYLRRIHYINQLRPGSLVLDEGNAWGLLENSCDAWQNVIVSYREFGVAVSR